jgi:hypothetical protein
VFFDLLAGKPYILPVVRKAERAVLNDDYKNYNHEYLAIAGFQPFINKARELMFGADSAALKANRIATVQTLSGTGSLSLGADFISTYFPKSAVYLPNPTWGNHDQIFGRGSAVKKYRYWHAKNRVLDITGMLEDIRNAPEKSVILLHAVSPAALRARAPFRCAHSPALCRACCSALTTRLVLTPPTISGSRSPPFARSATTFPTSTAPTRVSCCCAFDAIGVCLVRLLAVASCRSC